jgi:hypothetical protein
MNSLATVWTNLERKLAASPEDWPVYVCPAGHEIALPPFSRLWNKETDRLIHPPECFDCEKTRMALQRSQPHRFADREAALRAHGVPARLARQTFEGGVPHVLGYDLAAWSGSPDTWAIVLHGARDAGKSMLAAELLWRRLPHLRTAAWWRASHLLDALFGALGEETRTRAHTECAADLLVIDDLGRGMGDRGLEFLFNVIASRHEEDHASIFTFNESLVAFCKQHWSIGSRLTRDTIAVPFDQTYAERTRREGPKSGKRAADAQ